jgi:YD repeat-containing protein
VSLLVTVTRPDGKLRRFHYEDETLNNAYALTGITDERGVRYSTFRYDAEGRPILTEHGGPDRYTFEYDEVGKTVTSTNPLSKRTVYKYTDTVQNTRLLTSVVGEPSPNCR